MNSANFRALANRVLTDGLRTLALVFLLLASFASSASTLIHNVRGYTMSDGEVQKFGAIEFADGRIIALYNKRPTNTEATHIIDGEQRTMLPGLIDSHGHVASFGRALQTVDLVGTESETEAVARVGAFLDRPSMSSAEQRWLLGRGWNQVLWEGGDYPDRKSLDRFDGDVAIALNRIDGHAMWVNSKALALAGIDEDTPDPEGGQILRAEDGKATGVLIDNAMNYVFKVVPKESDRQTKNYVRTALQQLASVGLTSVHDAGAAAHDIRAMQALNKEGGLAIRVYAMLDVSDEANAKSIEQGIQLDKKHMLDIRSVKISADGALGSRGAAMLSDYNDQAGHTGLLLYKLEQLEQKMANAMAFGYQVNVHAIGDLANRRVLDLFENLQSQSLRPLQRHRIEHAQILQPKDLQRFAQLGIIASVQPTHATSDKNMAADRIGEKRLKAAYAWRSLMQSNARVAGGSDFPVEPANPFFGLHAAVTRQDRDNQPQGGWLPKEKLTRAQALELFTEGAAYAAHQENEIGKLLPGYWADFVLLADDYFTVDEKDIWRLQVDATYVAGKRVYQR